MLPRKAMQEKWKGCRQNGNISPVVGYNIRFSEAFRSIANLIKKKCLELYFVFKLLLDKI